MFRVCVVIFSIICALRIQAEPQLVDAVESNLRGGLPNFFHKLTTQKSVKIAYLGGSITAQPGYRVLSRKWFQDKYPNCQIDEINAAIGGTGSQLGVFRLEYDILRHKPDLLIIEFAVNDGGTSPDTIKRAFEGIIRQTWNLDSYTDILFVYTLVDQMVPTLQEGKFPRAASVMEEVANHYNIPSIHMGVEIADLVKQGKLIMKDEKGEMTAVSGKSLDEGSGVGTVMVFSKDGVHPFTDTGHVLYMNAIERSINKMNKTTKPFKHITPTPIMANHWEAATRINFSELKPSADYWELLPTDKGLGKTFNNRLPEIWKVSKPGASITFKFKGTYLGFFDFLGPDGGEIEVDVDGTKRNYKRIDAYCTYTRLSQIVVSDNLSDEEHTVTITLKDTKLDKKNILFEKNREDFDKNPAKYKEHNWYVGAVFISGKMIK
jgi:hypothetical protein